MDQDPRLVVKKPSQAHAEPLCRRLRSKQMYMEIEPDPDLPPTEDGFVWCTHTMNCLGPDGKVADPETCLAGRGCFEHT